MTKKIRDKKIRKILLKHLLQRELSTAELCHMVRKEITDRRFCLNPAIISSNLVVMRNENILVSRVIYGERKVRLWSINE